MKDVRLPTLFEIIIVLGSFLALVMSFTVFLDLPIQLALFISWFIAMILGIRLGYSYKDMQNAILHGISNGLEAVLILVSVGALIGTWIAGGVVPTLIYYGLEFIHPSIFLLATLIICSIMSVATGTSWGTVGTAGIAMIAIGEGLGIPLPLVAGAILSGAYFGDKLSPLSDSTVLASSLSKVDVLDHVRAMLFVGMLSSLVVIIFGLGFGGLLEKLGVLKVIVSMFEKKLTSAGNVTLSTLIVAFLANIFGCAMYVSLILTPKIMEDSYDRLHLDRRVLSRNSEVGGTLTSGMVPWSDNGIYMAGILGVSTFSYLPFMWLSFVAIGLAIIYGYTGKFIWYTKNNTVKAEKLG